MPHAQPHNNMSQEYDNAEEERLRYELEQIRSRLGGTEHLDVEELYRTLRKRMRWIGRLIWGEIILAPILIAVFAVATHTAGFSPYLTIAVAILLITSVLFDVFINMGAGETGKDRDTRKAIGVLLRMKTLRKRNELFSIPFALLILAWVVYEAAELYAFKWQAVAALIVVFAVSAVVSLYVAWRIYRKMQRTNDAIIEELNKLNEEV